MNNWLLGLAFSLVSLFSQGQINVNFLEHLSKNELKIEHWTYLKTQKIQNDSVTYHLSKYHLQYRNDSLFIREVRRVPNLFFEDTNALHYANTYFLDRENAYSQAWFNELHTSSNELSGIPFIYYSAYHPNNVDINRISKNLREDFIRLQKIDRKKPFLAATFSTFIPGTGKLYIGSPRSFLVTFVSLSILGLQTWESYSRMGIKHPLTIINGSLFTLYYATNIFGSFRETKMKKKNRRKQFLINASNYYHSTSPARLY